MWVGGFYRIIRMHLGEMGWADVNSIGLAQDRRRSWRAIVNSVLNLPVP
jgi:hypothetical protein